MTSLDRVRDVLFDNWAFFNRGYAAYITFVISLYNFINILILRGYELLPAATLLIIASLGVACNIIGRLDFKYGLFRRARRIEAKSNPFQRDLAQAIIYLSQDNKEKAIQVMEKWTKPIEVK